MQEELKKWRRWLHENAEVGFQTQNTLGYLEERLSEMGYQPKRIGKGGLVVTVGKARKGKKAFLLRADVDALPIEEKTQLPFACKRGKMHACGHDLHAAMLLGAAKLLKNREDQLTGQIKLLFQSAEEMLEGAKDVMEAGVLTSPSVGGAAMLHVLTGVPLPTGVFVVASAGVSAPAADYFSIEIKGKACHGSAPQNGVDGLLVAAYVLIALQEINARELSPAQTAVLTVGQLKMGGAPNVIAENVILKGTLRAFDEEVRSTVKKRMEEIAKTVAKSFRATARIRYDSGCPALVNDGGMSALSVKTLRCLFGEEQVFSSMELGGNIKEKSGGSEDFAYISHETPSVMVALAAGEPKKGYSYPLHHAKTDFDEEVLCRGAAAYAAIALAWLRE